MKKFLLKIAGFTVVLGTVLLGLKLSVPYHWGNPLFKQKADYLMQSEEPLNTLFVGNSRVYRHILPEIFDEIAGTQSFNLGTDGMFFLESQYVLEHFMEEFSKKEELETIFLSKATYAPLNAKMRHTNRSQYYMDFKRLRLSSNHFLKERDFEQFYYHLVSFVENKLCIGQVKSILKYHFVDVASFDEDMIAQKGFQGLDETMKPTLKQQEIVRYNETQVAILPIENPPYNFIHQLNKVKWFQPGSIDLERKYYFDPAHFTQAGAEIYTKQLAETFSSLLNVK